MNLLNKKFLTNSIFLAVFLSGIMFFLIHPFALFGYKFPDLGFLAWIYLVPLVVVIHYYDLKTKILVCILSSFIGHFGLLYWLIPAMSNYGGLSIFQAFVVLVVMVSFLSVIHGLFLGLASWVNHINKIPLFFLLPLFLLGHDYLLHYFPFGGFPWSMPVYSQGEWVRFFQWLDHTGAFGLNAYIYLVNGLFADGLILFLYKKQLDKMTARFVVIIVLALLSFYMSFLSKQNFEKEKENVATLNISLVQANIKQDMKWDPNRAQDHLNQYRRLTHLSVKNGADLVIWPETAYPYKLNEESFLKEKFLDEENLAVPLFFGGVTSFETETETQLFNSAIFVDTDAHIKSVYHKVHLVPFGEYLPFKKYLSFLSSLTQGVGEFTPGKEFVIFETKGVKFGNLICFEDIYYNIARQFAQKDVDVLVNYTNDAWYENTSAQYQHLVFSQFRALENRLPLIRSTNTGITAIIAPTGEVVNSIAPFESDYLLHNLKIEKANAPYTKYGNKWMRVPFVLACLVFIYTLIKYFSGPVKIEV